MERAAFIQIASELCSDWQEKGATPSLATTRPEKPTLWEEELAPGMKS
jgi:hypothetical protein